MSKLNLVNVNNEVIGSVDVSDGIFSSPVKPSLIHEVVTMQLASRRAGTHSTKTRSEVRGGGRKPWKQKGTGNARAGSSRSPLWRGGGVTFGPKPRDYSYSMPKKKVKAALRSILSSKYSEGRITIIDSIDIKDGKTKEAVAILKKFELNRGVLFIVEDLTDNAYRAFRNLEYVNFLHINGLNVYDIVNSYHLFITKNCLAKLEEKLGSLA